MKKLLLFLVLGIFFLGLILGAGSLSSFDGNFFEGFESGSLVTNNWTTSGAGNVWFIDTDPYAGTYNIMAEPSGDESVVETGLDTTNFKNISVSFYSYTGGLDGGEYVAADWYNGTDWIQLLPPVEDIATYTLYSYNLTSDASDNSDFAIRFRCLGNVPNEDCHVDDINVSGTKIIDITLDDYYGLNSSLDRVDEFNTSNLEEIEYMILNFSLDSVSVIDNWYLNFTANGTNGCSFGNKQSSVCYNYPNWIQFINGTETATFDARNGAAPGDAIIVTQTGSGNNINLSFQIDEYYNPNVFKWYDALYNFSDVKWQNGINQRIANDNIMKIEINQSIVPLDADQYKLDFRVNTTGDPEHLAAFACNSSYVAGDPHNYSGCVLIVEKATYEFQDVGTKFRGIFTKNLIDGIGDLKYILLMSHETNTSNYYSIKTYKARAANYTTHWEYSTDHGLIWNNSGDGYETELNINWFYDGADPTAFVYRLWTNTTDGTGDYLEGNITWNINPTNNYPPLANMLTPFIDETINLPYDVSFNSIDPNSDLLNVSLYLYQGGTLNKTLVTDLDENDTFYFWNDSTVDGVYDLILEACELGTPDLFCDNDTHTVIVDNTAPKWYNVSKNETVVYWNSTIKFNSSWIENNNLEGYIFSTNQTGIWINSSYVPFTGTSNVSENISVITANAGTNVGWFFFVNDSAGNSNQTDIQTFVVQSTPTNIAFVILPYSEADLGNMSGYYIYPQGRSPGHDYDAYVPFNVRYVNTLTNNSISVANCYATNDETEDNVSLVYNTTTGNYTGQVYTYLMAGEVNFSVECLDSNYDRATDSDIVHIHSFYTLIERENITYGGSNDSTSHWMRKGPFEGTLYTLVVETEMATGDNLIQKFPFCGSGTNCSYLRNFNWIGLQKFKINVSINDTVCKPFVCREVTDFNLNLRLQDCTDPQTVSADTPTIIEGNVTQNLTIQQDSYLFLNLYANCSAPVNLSTNIYFNYTDQPTTIEVHEAQPTQASSSILEEYQLDVGYSIGPNQTANVSKRAIIQFFNTVNNSQYLEYWYLAEADIVYPNSIIDNMNYIYNSTGQLLASDNVSADAPNTVIVYSDNRIFWKTEIIPANTTINETFDHSYKDALRNEETLTENISSRIVWDINLYNIFNLFGDVHQPLSNMTIWTNYSTYGVVDYSNFNVTMTTSQGTTYISGQTMIDNLTKTLTFPVVNFSNVIEEINYTITAIVDTCTYSDSGNWAVNCADNCVISSNVDLLGNNISIIGFGSFRTTANITNFTDLYISGINSSNRCEVYCSGGGCFK